MKHCGFEVGLDQPPHVADVVTKKNGFLESTA